MAASFIRSVNVGQNESDTKEFHKNLNFFISLFQRSLFKPCHQEDQPTVVPGRLKMEVYAASRRDLANAIQSYNDNDSITFISVAKVRRKNVTAKLYENMKVELFLKHPKYPL